MSQQATVISPSPQSAAASTTLVVLALLCVYIFWGSTYLAIRWAVETMPPYLLAAVRFLLSGGILMLLARVVFRASWPGGEAWRTAAITGTILLLLGNCTVVACSRHLPSGIVALLIGITPLYAALIEWLWLRRRRPSMGTWLALAAGFSGVVLLTAAALLAATNDTVPPLLPVVGVLAAAFCWTAGSLWSRSAPATSSPLMNAGAQMTAGGAVILVASLLLGEWSRLDPTIVSARSLWSLAYLIVFGSLIGYSAYIYTLEHTTATLATTYAFVNPLVAVALGAALGGEAITAKVALATVLIVGAVAFLTLDDIQRRRTAAIPPATDAATSPVVPKEP